MSGKIENLSPEIKMKVYNNDNPVDSGPKQ